MTKDSNVLIADDGMTLTNGTVYAKIVCLGANDSAENWTEVPESEGQEVDEAEALNILLGGAK